MWIQTGTKCQLGLVSQKRVGLDWHGHANLLSELLGNQSGPGPETKNLVANY